MESNAIAPLCEPVSTPTIHASEKNEHAFRFGIEEEYFLVDAVTRQIEPRPADELFINARWATEGRIDREFLQSQAEAATPPFFEVSDARTELRYIRQVTSAFAAEKGLALLACGTHPTARWRDTILSDKERYRAVLHDLQMVGRRNLLCGMHVHVEFPDPARRVPVMTQLIGYLPLLLALSTSSPFWQGEPTGLKGYRLAAYDELPRTGFPESFQTEEQFNAYVEAMVRSGMMEDASYLWWAIRPSTKYPTLELRVSDCCTRIDDAIAIASLYRALVRHFYYHPQSGRPSEPVDRALALENKWRAQRYGVHATFATRRGGQTAAEMLEHVLLMIEEDALLLDCSDEIQHCRKIIADGTSADTQLAIYSTQLAKDGRETAMNAVLAWIAEATKMV